MSSFKICTPTAIILNLVYSRILTGRFSLLGLERDYPRLLSGYRNHTRNEHLFLVVINNRNKK